MTSETLEQTTVAELVARDYRAAGVFERFGIDFCCGGWQSVANACLAAKAAPAVVAEALAALPPATQSAADDVTTWSVDRLIEHIVATHHAFVRAALPAIAAHLTKLVDVHGHRHPELGRIADAFNELALDLVQHMMKEERVLFPYFRELATTGGPAHGSPFGPVENPIRMMQREHQQAGDEMREIRALTNGYTAPADGCATYRVTFAKLEEFERDLHRHVHLENNVLFPKAVELEHVHRG